MKQPIIIVENLVHTYDNGFTALNKINLQIGAGEIVAIIGQNGAGKTTFVKHLNGLIRPTGGRVIVDGQDAAKEKVSTMAKKVGFVFQNPDHQIFKDTVYDEVAFGPENLGLNKQEVRQRVNEALEAVGLTNFSNYSPQNISKGQRQRVALASVLAMQTEIIVLDEPTTGQDYKESIQIMDLVAGLNERGHTVLFITHDMSLVARYARRAVVFCKGKVLLDNSVQKVFSEKEKLNETFLHPPQIMELAAAAALKGAEAVLTPEDLYKITVTKLRGSLNGCRN